MEAETLLNCARERLEMELREIDENPPTHISFGPVSHDDLFLWHGIIIGHMETPFEGGIFHLSIQFPSDYPFSPPEVKFLTKVYHPNIDDEDGTIHLKILGEEWSPALTTENLLLSISSILMDPILEYVQNPISDLYCNDMKSYNKVAKEWTKQYAMCQFPFDLSHSMKNLTI